MMAELQGQPEDPNAIFLQAAAEEATAKAAKARADTVKTVADAELSRAKTLETLSNVDMDSQDHALNMLETIGGAVQQQAAPMVTNQGVESPPMQ
jgi:DNA topoisomerase VI subunit A